MGFFSRTNVLMYKKSKVMYKKSKVNSQAQMTL